MVTKGPRDDVSTEEKAGKEQKWHFKSSGDREVVQVKDMDNNYISLRGGFKKNSQVTESRVQGRAVNN